MSYPYPAPYPPYQPVPRPVSTSTTGSKVLTFVGIAVLVVSIGLGVGGGFLIASGAGSMKETSREIDSKVDSVAIVTIQPGQTEAVELTSRTSYQLWLGTDGSTSTSARPTVTDPTGASLMVSTSSYTNSSWDVDESLKGWRFTSGEAGRYEITAASDGPTLQLVPGLELDTLIDGATGAIRAFGGVLLITVAAVLGVVGVSLLVGGAVWWSSRSKNARQVAQTGQPAV